MEAALILIILLAVFVFILMGVALHMAKTIEQLHQYISELERDMKRMNNQLFRATNADKDNPYNPLNPQHPL